MLRYNAKISGIPFVDQKIWFSLLQTLTYYTSFHKILDMRL